MNGGEARTECFNLNGVTDHAWEKIETTIITIDNTATKPVQDTSKSECADEWECPWLEGCW
jgi:hypothetical protein